MGKGKGKLESWYTSINNGVILFEFKNLRYGRTLYFLKQITYKLGINTKFCFNTFNRVSLPLSLSKKTFFKAI